MDSTNATRRCESRAKRDGALVTPWIAAFAACVGCGGPSPSGAGPLGALGLDAGASGVSLPDTGTGATLAPTPLSIRGFVHRSDGSALADATVCLERGIGLTPDLIMCTTSAEDGSFVVQGARPNASATLTFQRDGFAPMMRPMLTWAQDITLRAGDSTLLAAPLTFMGVAADPMKGQIPFVVRAPGGGALPAVSVTGREFDLGSLFDGPRVAPVYSDGSGAPAAGASAGVGGGFVNLPQGNYVLHFAFASANDIADVSAYYGESTQPAMAQTDVSVPVRAGYVSAPVVVSRGARP
jgi:hypothetical protein